MLELHKKRGETPLEALDRLREDRPELKGETLSYAGRLDPMAEGVLHILVGEEENARRQEFLNADKEYRAEFLLGYATDTGDVLGLLTGVDIKEASEDAIVSALQSFAEIRTQKYPWYSSKTVNGIPLFEYARKGDTSIERPTRNVEIYSIADISIELRDTKQIISQIMKDVRSVMGDFRQDEICDAWQKAPCPETVQIVSCTLNVSSGTYIRALTEVISEKIGVPVVLYSLTRTRIYRR